MNTSNPIVRDLIQSLPVLGRRPSLPCSRMRRWRGVWLSAVMLLMACGAASAQNVNVLGWTNGIFTVSSGVGTVSGWHLAYELAGQRPPW